MARQRITGSPRHRLARRIAFVGLLVCLVFALGGAAAHYHDGSSGSPQQCGLCQVSHAPVLASPLVLGSPPPATLAELPEPAHPGIPFAPPRLPVPRSRAPPA